MPDICCDQLHTNNSIPWYASGWFMAILIIIFFIIFAILIWWGFQQMFTRVDRAIEKRLEQASQIIDRTFVRVETDLEKFFGLVGDDLIKFIEELIAKFGIDRTMQISEALRKRIEEMKEQDSTTKQHINNATRITNPVNKQTGLTSMPTPSLVTCNYKYTREI